MKKSPIITIGQVGLVLITVIVAIFKLSSLPPQIPIFYSQPGNGGRVVDSYMLLIIPLCLVVILLFNKFVLMKLCRDNNLIISILGVVNSFSIILSALICIKILFLVT